MKAALAIACTLLCASCWVYRGGPNYQYEPVSEVHGWTTKPELRQHSFWELARSPLHYRTDVWRFRHDMLVLEVENSSEQPQRVRIDAAEGSTTVPPVFAGRRDDSKSFREIAPGNAWIDVPPRATMCVRVMLEPLRGSATARIGDRIRFRIEDTCAEGGPVEFDFRLARIWRDYNCLPIFGD